MNRDIQKLAQELCAEFNGSVAVWHDVHAFESGTVKENFRLYVVGKISEAGSDLDALVEVARTKMKPENQASAILARAEKLEANAAALRASVGGAA